MSAHLASQPPGRLWRTITEPLSAGHDASNGGRQGADAEPSHPARIVAASYNGGGTCSGASPVGPSWLQTQSAQVPPARRCGAPHGMIRCMVTAGRAAHGHRASYHYGGTNDQRRPWGCGGGERWRGRWLLRRGHVDRGRRSRRISPACCMFAPRWRSPRRSPRRSRPSSESGLCLARTGSNGGCISAASPRSSAWPGGWGGTAELWTPP